MMSTFDDVVDPVRYRRVEWRIVSRDREVAVDDGKTSNSLQKADNLHLFKHARILMIV